MSKIRFSIVIPTRERHETLGYSIQTVLNQPFDDYELIIADNFSSPETKEVVDSFNSGKIKYVRSSGPLAMVDNWEFALQQTKGEFIIFFGDDDGIVNNALGILDSIISKTGFKLIRWERVYYSWPNMQPEIYANRLHVKFNYENTIVDGKELIKRVVDKRSDYTQLPMLYNAVVHHSLIEKHRQTTGRFFHSIVPDLYSGYVLAFSADKFLSLGTPMSINAGSAKSNGASFMFKKQSQQINSDYATLNNLSEVSFDEDVPLIRSTYAVAIEPLLRFQKASKINLDLYVMEKVFSDIIDSITVYDAEELESFTNLILQKAQNNGLDVTPIKQRFSKIRITNLASLAPPRLGFSQTELVLDGASFKLTNIVEVADFVSKFYDYAALDNIQLPLHQSAFSLPAMPLKTRVKKAVKILYHGKL